MSPVRPEMPPTITEQGPPKSLPLSVNSILSPERRTRSYECNLDKLKLDDVEPLTPTKRKNGIFGSFEKGIDQVRLLLTPNKKKRHDQGLKFCIYKVIRFPGLFMFWNNFTWNIFLVPHFLKCGVQILPSFSKRSIFDINIYIQKIFIY